MPLPRFEVPAGTINGINTVFTVSQPYLPGTTAVFLNGLLQERNLDDGWFETSPALGTVTLKEAPQGSGTCPDVLQIFYLDTSPALPETEVTPMFGVLREIDVLEGELVLLDGLDGLLRPSGSLHGDLLDPSVIQAHLSDLSPLSGLLLECN